MSDTGKWTNEYGYTKLHLAVIHLSKDEVLEALKDHDVDEFTGPGYADIQTHPCLLYTSPSPRD